MRLEFEYVDQISFFPIKRLRSLFTILPVLLGDTHDNNLFGIKSYDENNASAPVLGYKDPSIKIYMDLYIITSYKNEGKWQNAINFWCNVGKHIGHRGRVIAVESHRDQPKHWKAKCLKFIPQPIDHKVN